MNEKDAEHVGWSQTLLVECIQIIIHESGGKMIPIGECFLSFSIICAEIELQYGFPARPRLITWSANLGIIREFTTENSALGLGP
jgi:hypothetical protein